MSRIGSHTLDEYPMPTVRIACERCGRDGSYRLDRLIARFGAELAACERRADYSRPCGARFTDLVARA